MQMFRVRYKTAKRMLICFDFVVVGQYTTGKVMKGCAPVALVGGDGSVFSLERDSMPDWSRSNSRGSLDSDQSTLCLVKPVTTHSTSYPSLLGDYKYILSSNTL